MRIAWQRLVASLAYTASLVAITACAVTDTYEEQSIELDPIASSKSSSLDADWLTVTLTLKTMGLASAGDHNVRTGPYLVWVVIEERDPWRDVLKRIDISEAVLEVYQGGKLDHRIDLPTAVTDWTQAKTPQLGQHFTLPSAKVAPLKLNFASLSEVRFRLRFTGVYSNGDCQEYWVDQRLKPTTTKGEFNVMPCLPLLPCT